eukprot:s1163_g2.t2
MVNELHPGSLHAWTLALVKCFLNAKTPFGYYVSCSIRSCRLGRLAKSSALFPIPVPFEAAWLSRPKSGANRRYRTALRRAVHLCIAALNFMYLEAPFASLVGLRRCPNALHVQVYGRLEALIRAGGPTGIFSSLGCGRKSFQLDARLGELTGTLRRLGLDSRSSYGGGGGDRALHSASLRVPIFNDKDELVPYRALDPSRLKLSGTGSWDCSPYLCDLLYMPFVEPKINLFDIEPPAKFVPDFSTITEQVTLDLCRVWDEKSLLRLFPAELGPQRKIGCTKVFNNYKNPAADRQIGDRRSQNFKEGRLPGPSIGLPSGRELLQVCPKRYHEKLVGCIADRRDFYHQFQVTDERAVTNGIFPFLDARKLCQMKAYDEMFRKFGKRKKADREETGDNLHGAPRPILVHESSTVIACFGALYQGDHLGVEFATQAHSRLLAEHGLLQKGKQFLATSPLVSDRVADGLVIDDFFSISCEALEDEASEGFASVKHFNIAKEAYRGEGLIGSDDKDVVAACRFKVIGAEVLSDAATVKRGAVVVGSPFEKRLGLGLCSAQSAMLSHTSDALHASLVGSWVSVLTFRRQAMAVANEIFNVIPPKLLDTDKPALWKLPRGAANELQVLAALAPVLCSNVAVPFDDDVYATDASEAMGGIAVATVGAQLSSVLWRTADRKGRCVVMMLRASAVLSQHDAMFEEDHERSFLQEQHDSEVPRPIGLRFQFIEICGGAGKVTSKLIKLGVVCGPVLDIALSRHYNLAEHRVISWVAFMLEDDRLESFLVAPPCTTFSPAAFPCLRSYRIPQGFDPRHPRVHLGNLLAFAAIFLLFVALRMQKLGMGEQPRRSKMCWLPQWLALLALGASEAFVASCSFGSPHQKEFCFVGVHMAMDLLESKCTRDHQHVPIQGAFTKPSATYIDGLAEHLARFFFKHLSARDSARQRLELGVEGLEDLLTNDVSTGLDWREMDSWAWQGSSHINVLESRSTLKLFRSVALKGGDVRFCYLGDSHVSRSAFARGRSSSHALRPVLLKAGSVCIAFGLYPAGRFVPTRINPGDAPSRKAKIPRPVPNAIFRESKLSELAVLASLCKLRRWVSNWTRLVLLLSPKLLQILASSECIRKHPPFYANDHEWQMDFDATLGYPGEGHSVFGFWTFVCLSQFALTPAVRAGGGASHGDAARRASRAGVILTDGRRVTETTAFTRDWLYAGFESWVVEKGWQIHDVVYKNPPDVDFLNKVLVEYGRWLFSEGKPYYHYSETLNSISSRRPSLRRMMQQAWDLAFLWGSYEPTSHHVAMPVQILIAFVATALSWGWTREAAVFSLAWGALLRIGEVLQARRADLIMPQDVEGTIDYVLLRIWEPKTRFKAARHQAGKLEQPDLMEAEICENSFEAETT